MSPSEKERYSMRGKRSKPEPWFGVFAGIALCCLLVACTGGLGARTDNLMQQDAAVMDDEQLRGYYQQLSDQLARETRAQRMGSSPFGGPPPAAEDSEKTPENERIESLRERWNKVRSLLRERGELP